jgi:uncharacterized damage-inducible protein DinB
MSVFTNPADRSAEEADAYVAAVLGLVGDRDPMAILRTTPATLEAALAGLTDDQLVWPERAGKWSVGHVVQHLADSELVWGYRLRMVLAQERPELAGYDQDLWADRLGYDRVDAHRALRDFAALRAMNIRLLDDASPADLERVAVHAERGEESVAHMIRLYAGHDLLHLRQIERVRGSLRHGS